MSHDVHLHVCIPACGNDGVAQAAVAFLQAHDLSDCPEAVWFLKDLSARTGDNRGPRGGVILWGTVGNYTDEYIFTGCLFSFWEELLSGVADGPLPHKHILVFSEHETMERAIAQEIFWDEDEPSMLNMVTHDCPFSFGQF